MGKVHSLPPAGPSIEEALRDYNTGAYDDEPPVEFLRYLVLEFGDPAPALARLALRTRDKELSETAALMIALVGMERSVPGAVKDRFRDAVVPILRAALDTGSLPEHVDRVILPLLSLLGEKPGAADLARIKGPEPGSFGVHLREMERAGIEGLEEVLRSIDLLGAPGVKPLLPGTAEIDEALSFCGRALSEEPRVGTVLASVAAAAAMQGGHDPAPVVALLEAVASTGTPAAAWYLRELGTWPGGGAGGRAAARLADGLAARGVEPRVEPPGRFVRAMATAVDGAGSRSLVLLREDPEGAVLGLTLLLNEPRGMLDLWMIHEDGASLESSFRASNLTLAPVGLSFLRSLLGDTLHRHALSGRPIPCSLLLYRPLFGSDPVEPAEHVPDPGIPEGDSSLRGPPSGEGTEALLHRVQWGEFWFASEATYSFLGRAFDAGDEVLDPEGSLLEEFAVEVLPGEIPLLLRRVDQILQIESMAGVRGRKALPGRRLRRALASGEVPPESIPYVRGLMMRAILTVGENLRFGFRSQEEVNRFEMEEEAAEMEAERQAEAEEDWGLRT